MFNTNKEVKRRLSIVLALVMVLSLCSGFGFVRTETVWAAEDVVTEGEDAGVASGDPIEPVVAYPIRLAKADGALEIWAYDNEGNQIEEAEAGTEVTVEVNMECELMQQYKFMGFIVWEMLEDGTANMENVILDAFDMENAETVVTFDMPACGVVVGISYGPYWQELSVNGGAVTKIDGETLEDLEFVFEGQMIANAEITIEAEVPEGMKFVRWEVLSENVELADPTSPVTTFVMPKEDVQIEVVYRNEYLPIMTPSIGAVLVFDSEGNPITEAKPGDEITVEIDLNHEIFQNETFALFSFRYLDENGERGETFLRVEQWQMGENVTEHTITMPECEYGIYVGFGTSPYMSVLEVLNGEVTEIDGEVFEDYEFETYNVFANANVTIQADEKEGSVFLRWEVLSENVELADPTSPVTTFVMPKENVQIEAVYKSEYLPLYFNNVGGVDIWAEDSEGNRITEAKAGEKVTVTIDVEDDFFQIKKYMGLIVWEANEDSTPNYEKAPVFDYLGTENPPATGTFTMPECEYGVRIGFGYDGYWNALTISNGKPTKIYGETLEEMGFVFEGQMLVNAEVTIEADEIANAIFLKWSSNNDEVKFANAYAKTTTFVMPKSDVKVYALYEYLDVSTPIPAPSTPSQPSTPDVEDKEDVPGSKPTTGKDTEDSTKPGATTKPEEVKNPDVITEQDVYTKEEQEKLAEFKLPQIAEEVKEKVESVVQEIQNFFNKISEEVKEKLAENITFEKAPATEHSLATALNNNPVDLMSKSLSLREQKRIEAGEKLNMYMEVKDATETVSKHEKTLVEKTMQDISAILNEGKAEGAERKTELGMYLDLNLMKQIGDDKAKKVSNPKGDVDVSIQVPENLLNKDANVQRLYQIICVQNGKSVLLDTEFNTKTNTLSFKTDKFVTFALIYTDVPVEKKTEK